MNLTTRFPLILTCFPFLGRYNNDGSVSLAFPCPPSFAAAPPPLPPTPPRRPRLLPSLLRRAALAYSSPPRAAVPPPPPLPRSAAASSPAPPHCPRLLLPTPHRGRLLLPHPSAPPSPLPPLLRSAAASSSLHSSVAQHTRTRLPPHATAAPARSRNRCPPPLPATSRSLFPNPPFPSLLPLICTTAASLLPLLLPSRFSAIPHPSAPPPPPPPPTPRRVAAVAIKNGDASVYKIIHGYVKAKQKNISIIRVATNVAGKAASNKFSRKTSDVFDSLIQKQQSKWGNKAGPLLSGISYCIASCSMILLNKVVLSSYNFNAGISLMLYQNLICVVILLVLEFFRVSSTEKFTWKLIKVWIPVNLIFIRMLVTGMYSLKYINVAMVTILKNMTNILTAIGEIYIFRKG